MKDFPLTCNDCANALAVGCPPDMEWVEVKALYGDRWSPAFHINVEGTRTGYWYTHRTPSNPSGEYGHVHGWRYPEKK